MIDSSHSSNQPRDWEINGSDIEDAPENASVFSSIEFWLSDHIIDPLSVIITIILGLAYWITSEDIIRHLPLSTDSQLRFQEITIFLVIPLLILYFFIYWLQHRRNARSSKLQERLLKVVEKNKRLQEENMQLKDERSRSIQDIQSLCEGYLYSLAKGPLKFKNDSNSHERLTLYAHDSNGQFIPIGRYSLNPDYTTKGRPSYPEREGCIAKTWQNGWYFANDYPDPGTDPQGYYERCKMDGMSDDNIAGIRMKSRLYCGYRISDTQGKKSIAVLITEATNPHRYSEVELKKLFQKTESQYLSELTERLSPWMPSGKEAKDRGF